MALGGEVQVDHRSSEAAVAKVLLNSPDVDTGLEKMCGIAVAKRMNGNPFLDIEIGQCPAQGPLDRRFIHGRGRRWGLFSASSEFWKDQLGIAMGRPITPKDVKGCHR